MATITGSTNNSKYSLTCEYTYTQNSSAKTSTITAIVYLNGNGYSTTSSYWCCTINGTQVTTNMSATVSGKTELGRRTWTVNHNSDGTCSTTISFSFSNRVTAGTYTVSSGSGSSNVTLTTISGGGDSGSGSTAAASTFSLSTTSAVIGSTSVTVNISRSSSSYTHKVKVNWGGTWYLYKERVETSYSFTPPMNYCNTIPNATSGTATVKVETINSSGSWVGEATKTMTFTVPSSVVPTVGISVTANNTSNGAYIANKTTFTCTATNAAGSYGSTIKSYQWSGGYLNSTSSSATTGTLGGGDYTLTVKVTDSRGRTASASKKVTVIGVKQPTLSGSIYRCNSSGAKDVGGTYAKASITYSIDSTGSNAKQYAIYWRSKGASSWTTYKNWTNLSNYTGSSTSFDLGGGWDAAKSYDVKFSIKDSYNTVSIESSIPAKSALLNLEKGGVGIGKYWEHGALDIGGDVYCTGGLTLDGSCRVGAGKYFYGTGSDGSNISIGFINQSTNAVELGNSSKNTTIKAYNNPTWYTSNGSKSYTFLTTMDCTYSSGGGCQTWRYTNGMQVSIVKTYGTWNVSTAWGNVYSSPHIAGQAFNVAFLEAPKVMINAYNDNATAMMVCQTSAPTTTATGAVYLWKPTSQTGVKTWIEYIAIGRWK